MDSQTDTINSYLFAINTFLFLLCSLLTISMTGKLYYNHRIRTLEMMATAEADDEIMRISRICEGRLFGWWKKWRFFLNDTTGRYETLGIADKDVGQCKDTNDDGKGVTL